jgi:hypothetical protein
MGEADLTVFPFRFNRSVGLEGRAERLTADAGVLALRELDERLGFTRALAAGLDDPRNQRLITHPFAELLRSRLYAMVQGHRDQDDLDAMRDDPALRLAVSERRGDGPLRPVGEDELVPDGLASQPTQSRLIETLSRPENLAALPGLLFDSAVRGQRALRGNRRVRSMTIDVDSFPIDVHGNQAGGESNGYYHRRVYHPLIAMNAQTGDWLDACLRPGAVHTATVLEEFVMPLIERAESEICQEATLRADAGMPSPGLLTALEHHERGGRRRRGVRYAFRLSGNRRLDSLAAPHLRRPVGRPPNRERIWTHELRYRAKSWDKERRVVLVVIDDPGELFLKHFFLLTSFDEQAMDGPALLAHYRERGTMEGHIGELKDVLRPALSSSSRGRGDDPGRDGFCANAATLMLYALAYNLANTLRRVTAQATGTAWSLKRLRERVLRVPARMVLHARRIVVVLRDETLPLWNAMLKRLTQLLPGAPPTGA